MSGVMNTFDGIKELTGSQERHPGGHNFPDMEVVVETLIHDIEDGQIYLVELRSQTVIKKLIDNGNNVMVHPALSAVHGQRTVEVFGRQMQCQTVEFSDCYAKRAVNVIGKVIGIWAGAS